MEHEKFRDAVELVGGVGKMAALLGVSSPAVSQVASGARRVPAAWCPLIERETGHEIRCEDLRHDIAWSVLRRR